MTLQGLPDLFGSFMDPSVLFCRGTGQFRPEAVVSCIRFARLPRLRTTLPMEPWPVSARVPGRARNGRRAL